MSDEPIETIMLPSSDVDLLCYAGRTATRILTERARECDDWGFPRTAEQLRKDIERLESILERLEK